MTSTQIDPRFIKGWEFFDGREYFEAHEIWEELWHDCEGLRHDFIQGLIQVAVALHHAGNGNWAGATKLLSRCLEYLERGQLESHPVNYPILKGLVLEFANAVALARSSEGPIEELPYFKLPVIGDLPK